MICACPTPLDIPQQQQDQAWNAGGVHAYLVLGRQNAAYKPPVQTRPVGYPLWIAQKLRETPVGYSPDILRKSGLLRHALSHAPASSAEPLDTLPMSAPTTSDVWHTDILDEVVCQRGDDLLDELFACLATATSLLAELIDEDTDPVGFPSPAE
ncbi:hypothetical protein B0H14DRAFT_3451154 [Mycena olivaceomarginata]|nr:hypothetical protein B0H14DRAFT_3451154 [Mycena olivaceomarginata]